MECVGESAKGRQGIFVSFEGCDGCGKSTQVERFIAKLSDVGAHVVSVREPGSTEVGEKIRALLLDPNNASMVPASELLLYEAARAQLVEEVILPKLALDCVVVCDRYADSTYAYQYGGRDLDKASVVAANALGTCGVWPDITFLLKLDAGVGLDRAQSDHAQDRLESLGSSFQEKVLNAYVELAEENESRICVIDAHGTIEEVGERIWNAFVNAFPVFESVNSRLD